ncbi:hypothetical protein RM531_08555 [Salinisphaera sp. P385]|uniref:YdjC-like protein n=1 Tax=Spectribacter acetivorans TaxID=3075603 RepID=A0ABU3B9P0_9GAMM|nr:hypothetical protein [Salinisphaera sp. P385]MDT0618527.1 hypothetical protein [Salinisphaera sp. P385]
MIPEYIHHPLYLVVNVTGPLSPGADLTRDDIQRLLPEVSRLYPELAITSLSGASGLMLTYELQQQGMFLLRRFLQAQRQGPAALARCTPHRPEKPANVWPSFYVMPLSASGRARTPSPHMDAGDQRPMVEGRRLSEGLRDCLTARLEQTVQAAGIHTLGSFLSVPMLDVKHWHEAGRFFASIAEKKSVHLHTQNQLHLHYDPDCSEAVRIPFHTPEQWAGMGFTPNTYYQLRRELTRYHMVLTSLFDIPVEILRASPKVDFNDAGSVHALAHALRLNEPWLTQRRPMPPPDNESWLSVAPMDCVGDLMPGYELYQSNGHRRDLLASYYPVLPQSRSALQAHLREEAKRRGQALEFLDS